MSHIHFSDELVREYLLFRGFSGALKAFDADLKADKDKGFRVDKIVDQLYQYICNYDLTGLREAWNHLDTRLFTRLEQHFAPSIRKLENAVLKFYLINAWENNKQDKITEFFNKLTNELISQAEWKDWFVFPFIKNPEEHVVFSIYFTRQWQDTLLVSLHNFLAAVYQCMPQPTLSSFEESASRMVALQKENEVIRKGLINLLNDQEKVIGPEQPSVQGLDAIMDDFFSISQEIKEDENQSKILKTIMRNIGSMPASPKQENKDQPMRNSHRKHSVKKPPSTKRSLSIEARPTHLKQRERDSSLDLATARAREPVREMSQREQKEAGEKGEKGEKGERGEKGNFLILSREEYSEHKCHITSVRFNSTGTFIASGDVEGNLKIWCVSPSCKTIGSYSSKFPITCLEWVTSHERYIMCGTSNGLIVLYDTFPTWSLNMENESLSRVEDIVSSPVDPVVVAIFSGKVVLIDLKSRKMEKCLNVSSEATCVKMNHNGQLVMVGTQEGSVVVVDVRRNQVIDKWTQHRSPIDQLEVTANCTLLYTLSRDKIHCKPLHQAKSKGLAITLPEEMKIHPEVHGRLLCLNSTGTLLLTVGVNSGVIYKLHDASLLKTLELGGHKAMLTCLDWSFANQCATCVTASQDGKIKISTLLMNSL